MQTSYHNAVLERYRETRAANLGCAPSDFDGHSLVIVPRPESTDGKFVMMALTFGTGTVVSIERAYLEWAKANAPTDHHYRALFPNVMLQPLAEEASRRGEAFGWRAPNLSFLPGDIPSAMDVPAGLRALPFAQAQRAEWLPSGEFHNALNKPTEPEDGSFRYGLALMDGEKPVAVAGGWDDCEGLIEIGVDVAREYRGRGLGEVVVSNFAAAIHARGEIPTYYCAPTNVRSHRNALACGFLPVASAAKASRLPPKAELSA
jgi:RimJ/RimL family protein N-acetyltransferase